MIDLPAYLRNKAEDYRNAARSDFRSEAVRLDHVAEWLEQRARALPISPDGWPCILCSAEPGDSCFTEAPERAHYQRGFDISITMPGDRTGGTGNIGSEESTAERCWPTVETGPVDLYRGRCLGCGHRSEPVIGENAGTETAMDHAWPGWRDKPVIERLPDDTSGKVGKKRVEAWTILAEQLYGEEWIREGGPIRTLRGPMGTRHVPSRTPFGGFDMSAGVDQELVRRIEAGAARRAAAVQAPVARTTEPTSLELPPLTLF